MNAPEKERSLWRDIASAPKDGNRVLVGAFFPQAADGSLEFGWWHCIAVWYRGEWSQDLPGTKPLNSEPTHWQPLPPPPAKPEGTKP